jgi:hypothetical protein
MGVIFPLPKAFLRDFDSATYVAWFRPNVTPSLLLITKESTIIINLNIVIIMILRPAQHIQHQRLAGQRERVPTIIIIFSNK